ncbi:MAG: pyridoxamine 5'-phosphate oxidase [Acidobacteriaceae bacterium]
MTNPIDAFDETARDPLPIFHAWFAAALISEPKDPTAMALATATPGGRPSVRMVLLKRADERGFVFYTNDRSRKGGELRSNPHAALCLYWESLGRQVRIEGSIAEVSSAEADGYFHSRARSSQIGAWASEQSRPVDSRATLEERTRRYELKYPGEIPRPPYWVGFLLQPHIIEFWHNRPSRLHDRVVFTRGASGWTRQRLYP